MIQKKKPIVPLKKEDKLIKTYDDHEDSVYSICWSNPDLNPWAFASLSYDGRVVINKVPDQEVLDNLLMK